MTLTEEEVFIHVLLEDYDGADDDLFQAQLAKHLSDDQRTLLATALKCRRESDFYD